MHKVFEPVSPDIATLVIELSEIENADPTSVGWMPIRDGFMKFSVGVTYEADPTGCVQFTVYMTEKYDFLCKFEGDAFDMSPHGWSGYLPWEPEFGSRADFDLTHEYDVPLNDAEIAAYHL